jgi:hypothetical protein
MREGNVSLKRQQETAQVNSSFDSAAALARLFK